MKTFDRNKDRAMKRNRLIYALAKETLDLTEPRNGDDYNLAHVQRAIAIANKMDKNLESSLELKFLEIPIVYDYSNMFDHGDFEKFPEEMQQAMRLSRQLKKDCNFDNVSVTEITQTLFGCAELTKDFEVGAKGAVVWSYGESPMEFYLKWLFHVETSRLMTTFLTTASHHGRLERPEVLKEGDLVTVESELDSHWYRARIVSFEPFGVVKTFYIDYGNVEYCSVARIKALSGELAEFMPLAFKCMAFEKMVDQNKIDGGLMKVFLKAVKSLDFPDCELISFVASANVWQVQLEYDNKFDELFREVKEADDESFDGIPYYENSPLAEEKRLLEYKTEDLMIRIRPEFNRKHPTKFTVVHAVDPFQIYVRVHLVNDDALFEKLELDLDAFYTAGGRNMKVVTSRVFVQRPYVLWNKERGHFERVVAKRVDTSLNHVVVSRLDFGNDVVAEVADLLEIHPAFLSIHSLVQVVFLVHILPRDNREYWSLGEIDIFHKLLQFSKICCGVFFPDREPTVSGDMKWSKNGIILTFDKSEYPFTLQAAMVSCGAAVGVGLSAGSPCAFQKDCKYLNAPFLGNLRASSQLKPGYDLFWGNRDYISHYFVNGQNYDESGKGNEINVNVGDLESLEQMAKLRIVLLDYSADGLPKSILRTLAWVDICHVIDPGNFYVRLRNELPVLASIMSKLQAEELNECDLIPGKFVVAQYCHQDVNLVSFPSSWNRGIILTVNPDRDLASVVLIDFGFEISVTGSKIRNMPKRYHSIPALCYRCHLFIPKYMPSTNGKWSSEAIRTFQNYITKWKPTYPMYFAFKSSPNVIVLDYYAQNVTYCEDVHDFKKFEDDYLSSKWAWMKSSMLNGNILAGSLLKSVLCWSVLR